MTEALGQPCSACAAQEYDGEVSAKLAYIALSGFKTFLKPCYVGPLDSSFSAIVGPNGLGKTVLADAVRFTLGSNTTSVRVKAAKEAINHQLLQSQGSKAACSTEEGVKCMMKKHGMDIGLLSCCVVSQTCLALDARDPLELINSLQKLLGTWHLQQEIDRLDKEISGKQQEAAELDSHCSQLQVRRSELRPEVDKLLQCYSMHEAQQRAAASTWGHLQPQVAKALRSLRHHVSECKQAHEEDMRKVQEASGHTTAANKALKASGMVILEQQAAVEDSIRAKKAAEKHRCSLEASQKMKQQQLAHHEQQKKAASGQLKTLEKEQEAAEGELRRLRGTLQPLKTLCCEQQQTLQRLIDSATTDARDGSCITAHTVDVSAADAAAESARHRLSSATVRRDAAARLRESSKDAAAHAWAAARAAEEACVKSAEVCTAAELRVKNTAEEAQEAQLEEREGALKRCRTALASAEQAVHDARAKVRHMGSLDAAVSSLLARGFKGELPGAVYGRMRDCVYVIQSAYVAPVATALRCGVNLASTLVTENRAAAVACLDYVTKAKAGCLKCLIMEEHRTKAAAHGQRAEMLHAWRKEFGAVVLSDVIEARPGCEGGLPLVRDLLSEWLLVPDWRAAEACAAAQQHLPRKFGIVTKKLEVIMPSCEVSSRRRNAASHTDPLAPQCKSVATGEIGTTSGLQAVDDKAAVAEVGRQKSCVQKALDAVAEAKARLQKVLEDSAEAKKALTQAKQKATRARSKAHSTKRAALEKDASCTAQEEALQCLEEEVAAASCQLNEAQHAQQAALTGRFAGLAEEQRMAAMHEQEELRGLQEQLGSLQAREAGLEEVVQSGLKERTRLKRLLECSKMADEATAAEKALKAAQKQERHCEDNVSGARQALKKAKTELRDAETALKSAETAHKAAAASTATSEARLQSLQKSVEASAKALEDVDARIAAMKKDLAAPSDPPLDPSPWQQVDAAVGVIAATRPDPTQDVPRNQAGSSESRGATPIHGEPPTTTVPNDDEETMHDRHTRQNSNVASRKAAAHSPSSSEDSVLRRKNVACIGSPSENVDAERVCRRAASKRRVLDDSSEDESPQQLPNSVSEDTQVPRVSNKDGISCRRRNNDGTAAAAVSSGPELAVKRRRIVKGGHETLDSDDIICDLEACMKEYENLMRKVAEASKEQKAEEEASTAAMHAVDNSSIDADRVARMELKKASQQVQQVRQGIEDLGTSREALLEERYSSFLTSITVIKAHVSEIFASLTGGVGDVELLFTHDRCLLFSEGVLMSVRPDTTAWRPFSQLSGGQQALAALALSFAVHSTKRAAWFLCDEVDAALDVSRAAHLAAYVARSRTQFLVISHKPQVFERANMLVMLYRDSDGTVACTVPVQSLENILPRQQDDQPAAERPGPCIASA